MTVFVSAKFEARPAERILIPRYNRRGAGRTASYCRQVAMNSVSLISIVDDDESVRESLEGLLKSVGFRVEAFALATDFLDSQALDSTDCLILDVRMPGMSGPELQRKLIANQHSIPIVFITAHGDEAVRGRVLGDGAVDCLFKPFTEDALLNAVNTALGEFGAESDSVSEKERKTMR
jgi:FixJ family two-component response regulator